MNIIKVFTTCKYENSQGTNKIHRKDMSQQARSKHLTPTKNKEILHNSMAYHNQPYALLRAGCEKPRPLILSIPRYEDNSIAVPFFKIFPLFLFFAPSKFPIVPFARKIVFRGTLITVHIGFTKIMYEKL